MNLVLLKFPYKIPMLFFAVSFLVFLLANQAKAEVYITDCIGLQNMNNNLSEDYYLDNDIDCSDTVTWNGGAGFIPIGRGSYFSGMFNGQGYTISNLYINSTTSQTALFSQITSIDVYEDGVYSFNLENANISGTSAVSAIAGRALNGTISDVRVSSSTISSSGTSVGCAAGYVQNSTVSLVKCENVTINSTYNGAAIIGGLIGNLFNGNLYYSTFRGIIYAPGAYRVAGIASQVSAALGDTDIDQASAVATITADGDAEGVGGAFSSISSNNLYSSTINNVYVRVEVFTESPVAGIAAVIANDGVLTLNKLYSVASTTSATRYGFFNDANSGGTVTVSNSFWNTESLATTTAYGELSYSFSGVTGKTTAEMKSLATYTSLVTLGLSSPWDFTNSPYDAVTFEGRWNMASTINEGYPYSTSEYVNLSPNTPHGLGEVNYINGSTINNSTPTLSFILSDDNVPDTLKYQIQIDDSSDFLSPVVSYTSGLSAQGNRSFTVGQPAGGGTYAQEGLGQTLSDGQYFWRVKAYDNNVASSAYAVASGGVAFVLNTRPQATGGGGLPSEAYFLPKVPSGGFRLVINNGQTNTSNSKLKVETNAGADVKYIALSLDPSFINVGQIPYSQNLEWNLCGYLPVCEDGFYTVYAKFYTAWGQQSEVVSARVYFQTGLSMLSLENLRGEKIYVNELLRNLKFGDRGDEVKKLQRILAQFPEIYPKALVTGYFGPLTLQAVKNFQVKYSVTSSGSGFGVVGPLTRALLNQILPEG